MAGHSKWKQIKHYKAATDAKRGALFTKLIREITMAAKMGGGDPAGNARLRVAIEAGKAKSLPKENIDRAIKKGTGELAGEDIQEVTYEGYGPGDVRIEPSLETRLWTQQGSPTSYLGTLGLRFFVNRSGWSVIPGLGFSVGSMESASLTGYRATLGIRVGS